MSQQMRMALVFWVIFGAAASVWIYDIWDSFEPAGELEAGFGLWDDHGEALKGGPEIKGGIIVDGNWVESPRPTYEESHYRIASWYGERFAGRQTTSGRPYDPDEFTAAARDIPLGTVLRVTRQLVVYVVVDDRGPFIQGRSIDLSRAAAEALGMVDVGVAEVLVEVVR